LLAFYDFPAEHGSIYARAMSLRARLRRFVTAPYVRRDVSRTRPRWP
jgi:hypothetical protein